MMFSQPRLRRLASQQAALLIGSISGSLTCLAAQLRQALVGKEVMEHE